MKYKYPNLLSGNKQELIISYLNDVSKLKTKIEKDNKVTRIGFYNVNMMHFLIENEKNIFKLCNDNKIDIINFIEYPFLNEFDELFNKKYEFNAEYYQYFNRFGLKCFSKDAITKYKTKNLDSPNSKEKRGLLHTTIGKYNIITTHLDVWDNTGKKRINEIEKLIRYIKKNDLENVILGGDFNEVNTSLFSKEHNQKLNDDFKKRLKVDYDMPSNIFTILKNNDFVNLFDCLDYEHPKFSCWSGKLVDYCFLYKPTWKGSLIDINLINCPYSDHGILMVDVI